MKYRKAKQLQSGDKIIVSKTNEEKTIVLTTECVGKNGIRYIDILCTDNTAYYNYEVNII